MLVNTCVKGAVVRRRMCVRKVYVSRGAKIVVCPKMKNEWNKWKNHFYEMKGDVGLSLHEKKGTRCLHQDTKSLITPSLHLCFFQDHNIHFHAKMLCCLLCLMHSSQTNKQYVRAKQRCRDGVISDFVSWCSPFFFMK